MGTAARADHHSAIVRLAKPNGETAGLGVLVDAQKVLTCAHVVNVALGVANKYESDRPEPTRLVSLDFPFVEGAPQFTATLVGGGWAPPPPSFGGSGSDVAVLQLREDSEQLADGTLPRVASAPKGATPAIFSWDPGPRKGSLWVFGYPGKPPRPHGMPVDLAVWGKLPGGRIVVQSTTDQSVKAQQGYSGSPVWRDDPAEVVGLLHAAPPAEVEERDGYVVPTEMIAAAWPEFAAVATPANPYRALQPFTAEDSTSFFGREAETRALYSTIMRRSVTVVSGASGVGKSSLVQAGLIPQLRAKPFQDRPWVVAQFRPRKDPLLHLATAMLLAEREVTAVAGAPSGKEAREKATELGLDGLGPSFEYFRAVGHELLVVADQFEEAWTATDVDREKLIDLLLPEADDEGAEPRVRIVLTIRSDVLLELQDQPGMGPRLADRVMPLSPLTVDAVRQAVEEPSTNRGVGFVEGLVDEIVEDAGVPASLPLLEFALHELWEQQSRRTLTREAYTALGRVGGALDLYAEEAFGRLDERSQAAADAILLRMVRTIPSERRALTTRQRIRRDDLKGQESVVRRLVDSYLVEADGDYLELAHEALISSWGRLRRLIDDNARFLVWQESMRGRSLDDPLPESRLLDAEQWVEGRGADIPSEELDLIRVSREVLDARRAEQTRAQLAERDRALALETAESLRLATEALDTASSEPDVALLVAWEGVLQNRNEYSESVFREVLSRLPAKVDTLIRTGERTTVGFLGPATVFAASVSGAVWFRRIGDSSGPRRLLVPGEGAAYVSPTPDRTGLLVYRDGVLRVYDPEVALATPENNTPLPPAGEITLRDAGPTPSSYELRVNVTVSSRGTCLVRDGDFGWLVNLGKPWSVVWSYRFANSNPIPDEEFTRLLTEDPDALSRAMEENYRLHHKDRLFRAVLDPTGEFIVTEAAASARLFPVDGTPPTPLAVEGGVFSTCVLADGAVVTGGMGGEGAIWNTNGRRRELFREPSEGRDLFIRAVDPFGRRFATTVNTSAVIDVRDPSGASVASFRGRDGDHFWSAAFSPDGRLLAAGSSDRTLRVWEVGGTEEPLVLTGHSATVDAVAFHPQRPDVLLSSDQDGEVRLWHLGTNGLTDWAGQQDGVKQLETVTPGAVVSSDDVSVEVWPREGIQTDLGGRLLDIFESPGGIGTFVLTQAGDLRTRLWSLGQEAPKELALLSKRRGGSGASRSVISPDGRHVLHIVGDVEDLEEVSTGSVIPLDRGDTESLRLDSSGWQSVGQGFRPDGTRVVVAAVNGGAWIWTSEGVLVGSFVTDYGFPDRTFDLDCDPQGEYIATGVRNEVGLWNWEGNKIDVLPVGGYKVFRVRWSPDGERIVTISDDPHGPPILELWTRKGERLSDLTWVGAWERDVPVFDRRSRYWAIRSGEAIALIGRDGERLGVLARPRGTSPGARPAISLDGEFVAASFRDGTALIWSQAERRRINTLRIGDHSGLAFSPDGRTLLAGRPNGVISRFALEIDDLFPSAAERVTRTLTTRELDRLGITRSRLSHETLNLYRETV